MHNDQRSAGLVLQSMSLQGNNSYHSPQIPGGLMPASLAASPARQRGRNRPSSSNSKKHCNCKNSRCLKLYCECFASGRYCDGCNCVNCCNNMENEVTRQSAVEAILERNPNAFRPKIQAGASDEGLVAGTARHNKGCNCKKSGCLKKYCECFQAGIYCGDNCKCIDCKNFEGSEAREAVALTAFQSADLASRHQPLPHSPSQTNNKRPRLSHMPMQRQPHPPLPSIPVSGRHSLPAIPEPLPSRSSMQHSRQRASHHHSGDLTHGAHAGHPLSSGHLNSGAPLNPALLPRSDGFVKETVQEMFKRGGIDEVCSLLVLVAQEQGDHQQATQLLSATNAILQARDAAQAAGQATGGTSKLYEAQEKAVLHEYQQVLQKLIDRASTKAEEHKQQQETPGQSVKRPTDSLSRPGSAPAGIGAAQQLAAGLATQGSGTTAVSDQATQPGQSLSQQKPQTHAQTQQTVSQAAIQQPPRVVYTGAASFVPTGNSTSMSISQLPVGNSHFRGDQYMLSCMGPQGGQQGGYQRPGSAQALGSRHSMQACMKVHVKFNPDGMNGMQAGTNPPTGAVNLLGPNHSGAPVTHPPGVVPIGSSETSRAPAAMVPMQLPTGSIAVGGPSLHPPSRPYPAQSMQHQLQQHLRHPHGANSDPRLVHYQAGAFSQPLANSGAFLQQPSGAPIGGYVQSLTGNPMVHSQLGQNQYGMVQHPQAGAMGQYMNVSYPQPGQFQAGAYAQQPRTVPQQARQARGQVQAGQPQAGHAQAMQGRGQFQAGQSHGMQLQTGQGSSASGQFQLNQAQREAFAQQPGQAQSPTGQIQAASFLQSPSPPQAQANTVKQEGLDTAAQSAQDSQDVPQPVFVAAEAMT